MRKFYLELDGVRIPLNNESGILFTNPSGLGTTMGNSFSEIRDGFFRRTDKRQKQGSISGDLTFFSSAYSAYETFVNKLFTAEKIVFVYDPTGTEYSIDVEVNYITKTESVLGIDITVPVSFTQKSMWYTDTALTGSSPFSISAGGHIGAAVSLTISGTFSSNLITATDADGEFLRINIPARDEVTYGNIKYSSIYDDSVSTIEVDGAVRQLIDYADSTRFYAHNSGKAFTLSVSNGTVSGSVKRYWRTV